MNNALALFLLILGYILGTSLVSVLVDYATGYEAEGSRFARITHNLVEELIGFGIALIVLSPLFNGVFK
jgi:hypothetical protein